MIERNNVNPTKENLKELGNRKGRRQQQNVIKRQYE